MDKFIGTIFATVLLTLVMGCTKMSKGNAEMNKGIKTFIVTKGIN